MPHPSRTASALLVAAGLILVGCESDDDPTIPSGRPTVAFLDEIADGDEVPYRVTIRWSASDPDHAITHYRYAIDPVEAGATGGRWISTEETEAALFLSTHEPDPDDPTRAIGDHVIGVVAIDEAGEESVPAFLDVTAVNRVPLVFLERPHDQPWGESFLSQVVVRWRGEDDVAGVLPPGFQLKLIANDPTEDRDTVLARLGAPGDAAIPASANVLIPADAVVPDEETVGGETFHASDWWPRRTQPLQGRFVTLTDLPDGQWLLAIRAVDEAGAITPWKAFDFASPTEAGNLSRLAISHAYPEPPVLRLEVGDDAWIFDQGVEVAELPVAPGRVLEVRLTDREASGARQVALGLDIPDPGCAGCIDESGLGAWTPWAPEIRWTLEVPDEGSVHVLYVRGRHVGGSGVRLGSLILRSAGAGRGPTTAGAAAIERTFGLLP